MTLTDTVMQEPHQPRRRNLLHRTAGPYSWVKTRPPVQRKHVSFDQLRTFSGHPTPLPPALDQEHTLADQRRDLLLDQILRHAAKRRSVAPGRNAPVLGKTMALSLSLRASKDWLWRGIHCTTTHVIKAAIKTKTAPPMAKPGPHGKDKQRCGARVRHRHGFCRKWPVPGKTRCRFHGGCSTGALTDEGKARSLAAMHAGRQRWLADMHAKKAAGEIERFPGGRKSGPRWVTPRMWGDRWRPCAEFRTGRDALRPPSAPARKRGCPTILAQAKEQILKAFSQLPEDSPLRSHPTVRAILERHHPKSA